jgi:hypothetical protein
LIESWPVEATRSKSFAASQVTPMGVFNDAASPNPVGVFQRNPPVLENFWTRLLPASAT